MLNKSDRPLTLATTPLLPRPLDLAMSLFDYVFSHFMPVPIVPIPVVAAVPISPVSVELIVVNTMILRRNRVSILGRYIHDNRWNCCDGDWNPGLVIHTGCEPVAVVVTVPGAPEEIHTECIGNHVDITLSAGNHYNIRRCCQFQRRRLLEGRTLLEEEPPAEGEVET
jgi:hypothetical protein